MAHYKIAVVTKTGTDEEIDELLEPYYIYNEIESKYDFYEIGGRWNNDLLLKNSNKRVNISQIKNIDFEKMKKENNDFIFWGLVTENGWEEIDRDFCCETNDVSKKNVKNFIELFNNYIELPENQEKYLAIIDCHE